MVKAINLAQAREKQLANPKTVAVPKSAKVAVPVKAAKDAVELVCKGEEITQADITRFIKEHAGGQPANVRVEVLPNVAMAEPKPVPFFSNVTYSRKGVRYSDLMDHLKGVKGDTRLSTIWQEGSKRGTSATNNLMTQMLLNGGQSRNSKSWGTSFVKLVVA
jgi:hypothetical protein